jgi:hypothetical protein
MARAKDAVAAIDGSGENSSDRAREVWQVTWRFSLLSGGGPVWDAPDAESQRHSHTERRAVKVLPQRGQQCAHDCDESATLTNRRPGRPKRALRRFVSLRSVSHPPSMRPALLCGGQEDRLSPGESDLRAVVLEARLQPVAGVVVPQLAVEIAGHDVFPGGDSAA